MSTESTGKWTDRIKLPRIFLIIVCALPAVMTILFYVLRSGREVMDWVAAYISSPIRGFLGLLSSVYPFSVMEVLCSAAAVWLIYFLVRTVMVTVRRRGKLKILSKRLLTLIVAVLYVWSIYCFLWNSGYFATGFAERNGFSGEGVAHDDLISVTRLFAEKANEFAPQVKRDEEGRFIEDRREFFAASTEIYNSITAEFPCLEGSIYRPKPMMYSWVMSRTGYTGIYFALTGESNINIRAPGFLMPATVAHELAHQRGVFAEDEANFVGIAACVTSGNAVYEYAGWLMGLMYLSGALSFTDLGAWLEISGGLCEEVNRDWRDNYDFWQAQKTFDTSIDLINDILAAVNETISDAVDTIYDGYLRSQSQELGIRSYGACVDLLVEYFS